MKKKPITNKRKTRRETMRAEYRFNYGKAKPNRFAAIESEDDSFEYQLENDPRFLARIESARQSLRQGRGIRLEEINTKPKSSLPRVAKTRHR